MKEKGLVSIIVPVYNIKSRYGHALEDLLDGIKSQTYNNIEVILVDDGSTDGSEVICDKYAQDDSRFVVFHRHNAGLCEARNTGLEHAHGDFIFFADADDLIHPQCIELMTNAANQHPECQMVVSKIKLTASPFKTIDSLNYEIYDSDIIIRETLQRGSFVSVWNKLIRKEIIEGIKFRQTEYEDLDYMLRTFLKTDKIIKLNHITYSWIQREDSSSHKHPERRFVGILKSLDYLYLNDIKDFHPLYSADLIWHTYAFYINNVRNSGVKMNNETRQDVEKQMKIINAHMYKDFMSSDAPLKKKLLLPILLRCPKLKKVGQKFIRILS